MSARSVTDKADRSANAILILVLSISAVRFFFSFNLPLLFLPMQVHDDGLFMRVATNLASGHWLGKFDQFTLMKGPGYPMFLALTGLSGLPVTATHALFEILALLITGWAAWRLTLSRLVGVLVFVVLAFYPAGFIDNLQRVFRDQVYWAQTLVILSLIFSSALQPSTHAGISIGAGQCCRVGPGLGLAHSRGGHMAVAGADTACPWSCSHKSGGRG